MILVIIHAVVAARMIVTAARIAIVRYRTASRGAATVVVEAAKWCS